MASEVYTISKFLLAEGSLDWIAPANVFRALLVDATYVFSSAQAYVSDVSSFEVSDASYARIDVTGRTASIDVPGERGLMDCNNLIFPSLTGITSTGAIIYKQIGGNDLTPDNDPLFCFVDFPTTSATGLNFLVELDPDGLVALTTC